MTGEMNLAYDYPLLGAFWTLLWIFLWVMWIFLLFRIFSDIFRDDSLNGWAKAGWSIFAVVLPFLGVFVYLIARGKGMGSAKRIRPEPGSMHSTATSARPPAPPGRVRPRNLRSSRKSRPEATSRTRSSSAPRRRSCTEAPFACESASGPAGGGPADPSRSLMSAGSEFTRYTVLTIPVPASGGAAGGAP